MREIGVALLGLGNVGAGVVALLRDSAPRIEARLGAKLVVRGIAVRDLAKSRAIEVDPGLLCTDALELATRDGVDIVCELIGGEDLALRIVRAAIGAGKHVVTANKALLAVHGTELFWGAESAGVHLHYEAAVCGGIPIIRTLREGLASDRIESIMGIVNGTSNYITCAMSQGGQSFSDVLANAQEAGYAEADPSLDVGGGDAAHKLAILAALSFRTQVRLEDIHVEGIESLTEFDYEKAREYGYVIKSLAIGRRRDAGIELRVHPTLVPSTWLLADVPDAKNAVYVRSFALGASMYYGAGAGMMPTAMSVVSDLIEVGRDTCLERSGERPESVSASLAVVPIGELRCRYYLRFPVADEPGVLGKLTTILGDCAVSIANLSQSPYSRDDGDHLGVFVVALTHEAREADVNQALQRISEAGLTTAPPQRLRIAE